MASLLKNRYQLINPIRSGTNGQVYISYDMLAHTSVAVKMIPLKRHDRPLFKVNRMISNEINNLVRLTGCKHVAQLYDVIAENNNIYLVQEYCGNHTVQDMISGVATQQLPLPYQVTRCILTDLAMALMNCHAHGIVHGDVKPSNIMYVHKDDIYKLIDLGSSCILDENTNTCYLDAATFVYAAPELISSVEPVGSSYDIWSFGKVCEDLTRVTANGSHCSVLKELTKMTLVTEPTRRASASRLVDFITSH